MSQYQEIGFKEKFTFQERKNEASKIMEDNPNCIPIVIEQAKNTKLDKLDKKKYLIKKNQKVSKLLLEVRKNMKLNQYEAFYFFVNENKNILHSNSLIEDIYKNYHDTDGFLYIQYSEMVTFG